MHSNKSLNILYTKTNLEKREIDLIICYVLNINTAGLFIYDKEVSQKQQQQIIKLCQQRLEGLPFAYITGLKSFWTLDLKVNKHTLIPRPETEMLVELVLQRTSLNFDGNILDLGTGTGAIALSIALERPKAQISAIDYSLECLNIAQFNKDKYSIQNVKFFQSDWFENIGSEKFNYIVSNPPYIEDTDMHLESLKYEPISALTSKNNGLADIIEIIDKAKNHLKKDGTLMLEHGFNQKTSVQQLLKQRSYKNVKSFNDLAGIPRITIAEF